VASSKAITDPSLTLSPTLTLTLFTVPAEGDGTSIVALSDSSVTSASSFATVSPALTKISMTGTSLKSPMSGTLTSTALIGGSPCWTPAHRKGLRRPCDEACARPQAAPSRCRSKHHPAHVGEDRGEIRSEASGGGAVDH